MLREGRDRLYIVEQDNEDEDDQDADGDITAPVQGRRIVVLSLQGDILQVVTHPTEPSATFQSICCFDDKLLARYFYFTESAGGYPDTGSAVKGMLVLQGL